MTLTTDLVIKIQWVDPKKLLILMNDIFSKKNINIGRSDVISI